MMPRAETAEVPDRRLGREGGHGRGRGSRGASRPAGSGRRRARRCREISAELGVREEGGRDARGGGRLRREGGRDGVSERLRGRPAVGAWWAASAMCTRIFMYTCGLRKLSHLSDTIIIFILGELFSLVG